MRAKNFLLLGIVFAIFISCSLYTPPKSREETFIKTKITSPSSKNLLILGFSYPGYDPEIGKKVSQIFHQEILKKRKLKRVVLKENLLWTMEGDEEESISNALRISDKMGFDLVLLGWVDKIVYGKLTPFEITLRIRLISVKNKKTLFYAYKREVKESKDLSYPLDQKLSIQTPYFEDVIRDIAEKLVSKMFADHKVKTFLLKYQKKGK